MKICRIMLLIVLLVMISCNDNSSEIQQQEVNLWPEIEPYHSGYLKVSEVHDIYYELCGNPKGKSVFVLHGGPGSGSSSMMRRFYNPKKFCIVLHDQRGSKRSKPYGELKGNTTWELVEDIEKLRNHLMLEKILLGAGSWGSTLALAYAEKYPENVDGMILRGVFFGTREEDDNYFWGAKKYFPVAHDKLLNSLPESKRSLGPEYILRHILTSDSTIGKKYSMAYDAYGYKISALEVSDETIQLSLKNWDRYVRILIESHYVENRWFLKEGQLLDNAYKLQSIPITIINGRYDVVMPPLYAYKLHKQLPHSKLIIVEKAGHSRSDPNIQKALIKAIREFE